MKVFDLTCEATQESEKNLRATPTLGAAEAVLGRGALTVGLGSAELVFVKVSGFAAMAVESVSRSLRELTEASHNVFAVVGFADLEEPRLVNLLKEAGIQQICVRMPLAAGVAQVGPWEVLRYASAFERSATFGQFMQLCASLSPSFVVTPWLELNSQGLPALEPTLRAFDDQKVPFTILDIDGLRGSVEQDVTRIRETFRMLRLRGVREMHVWFDPFSKRREQWTAWTDNVFAGPRRIDIDVANTCTHNCDFCGLYSPSAIEDLKARSGGKLPEFVVQQMKQRLDTETCLEFIRTLPPTVESVQFGGLGDPFTHPQMMSFIRAARARGFGVSCLTNFSYMTADMIEELHALCGEHGQIHFIVNLSAASAETYVKVRPNQRAGTFTKVIESIRLTTALANRDRGRGMYITLMSVTNRTNFRDIPSFVRLARELDVDDVWIKPMEVHGATHIPLLVRDPSELEEYRQLVREAMRISLADGPKLFEPETLARVAEGAFV